jgi:hypothetical protein
VILTKARGHPLKIGDSGFGPTQKKIAAEHIIEAVSAPLEKGFDGLLLDFHQIVRQLSCARHFGGKRSQTEMNQKIWRTVSFEIIAIQGEMTRIIGNDRCLG